MTPTPAPDPVPTTRRMRLFPRIVVAALALTVILVAANRLRHRFTHRDDALARIPVFTVESGPLTISVTESGTVNALNQIEIKSEVEGQTTILYLIPEGTRVQPGDLLAELDSAALNDSLVEQQIRVFNADAAFIRARENLAVTHNQAEADIARAELDFQFAGEDLVKYEQGDYPRQLMEAEARITLAREELEQATQTLAWSETLFAEHYISQTELERDRLSRRRAELDLQLAQAALALLTDFTHNRRLDELRSMAQQTEMTLERVRRRAGADIVQAEADHKAREAEFNRQTQRLNRIEVQIEKTRIVAPRDGMVVYGTTGQSRWQTGEPLQEGQSVRERQTLIYLPSPGSMMVEVRVHESALDKVAVGQTAWITLDALPGRSFSGTVVRIAPLPDGSMRWMNPDLKVYNTQINLDGAATELRTGMSCRAEIIVQQFDRVLSVPLQAVIRVEGQPTVFVRESRGFVERPVTMGFDNNRRVHILDGLKVGDVISLTPPLDRATRPDDHGDVQNGQPPDDASAPPTTAESRQAEAPPTDRARRTTSERTGGRPENAPTGQP